MLKAVAIAPGSCGELVQGILAGRNFHVTCPINLFSEVTVELKKKQPVVVSPTHIKVKLAVEKTLKYFKASDWGALVRVDSMLPVGKGMASSTADIVAACEATALALGYHLEEEQLANLALAIEPSDGIMFKGIVSFDHLRGGRPDYIGQALPLEVVILEPPQTINTLVFNKFKSKLPYSEDILVKRALSLVKEGIRQRNPALVGKAATLSAQANQKILPKLSLERILNLSYLLKAYGVVVAHSGTVVGLLVEPGCGREIKKFIEGRMPQTFRILIAHLINGGIYEKFLRNRERSFWLVN